MSDQLSSDNGENGFEKVEDVPISTSNIPIPTGTDTPGPDMEMEPAAPAPAPAPAAEKITAAADSTCASSSLCAAGEMPAFNCCLCTHLKNVDPRVKDLVLWKDYRMTTPVVVTGVLLLFSLECCSLIAVVGYVGISCLLVVGAYRLYRQLFGMIHANQASAAASAQPTQARYDADPLKECVENCMKEISEERAHKIVSEMLPHVNKLISELKRVVLLEDLVLTFKYAVICWLLTYLGSWFNVLTLILINFLLVFTVPIFYIKYKEQIDAVMKIAKEYMNEAIEKVKAKLPLKQKSQ